MSTKKYEHFAEVLRELCVDETTRLHVTKWTEKAISVTASRDDGSAEGYIIDLIAGTIHMDWHEHPFEPEVIE